VVDDADYIASSTGPGSDAVTLQLAAGSLPLAGTVALIVRHTVGIPEGFDVGRWDEEAFSA
jgi:hypothetical protein